MNGFFPQGDYNALPDAMLYRRLHSYNFLTDIINVVSKEGHKVITVVLLSNLYFLLV